MPLYSVVVVKHAGLLHSIISLVHVNWFFRNSFASPAWLYYFVCATSSGYRHHHFHHFQVRTYGLKHTVLINLIKNVFSKLLIGHFYFHKECKYRIVSESMSSFSQTFTLETNVSTNLYDCADWMSKVADKLIVCVSRHQELFDRQDVNHNNRNLKGKIRQSITDELDVDRLHWGCAASVLCPVPSSHSHWMHRVQHGAGLLKLRDKRGSTVIKDFTQDCMT